MFVCTQSGSVYEVDFRSRMLRRLGGTTKRGSMLVDGIWRGYQQVISRDGRLVFFWSTGPNEENIVMMSTTPVVAVSASLGLG